MRWANFGEGVRWVVDHGNAQNNSHVFCNAQYAQQRLSVTRIVASCMATNYRWLLERMWYLRSFAESNVWLRTGLDLVSAFINLIDFEAEYLRESQKHLAILGYFSLATT
jgi:hypothetical protein